MKILLVVLVTCVWLPVSSLQAQVAISTTAATAQPSAMLDVRSSNKGILIPRTSTSGLLSISNPAKGLLIYDTTSSVFRYYDGSSWKQFTNDNNGWNVLGNTGTGSNSFIGTIDDQSLNFSVHGLPAGKLNEHNSSTFFGVSSGRSFSADPAVTRLTGIGFNSLANNISGTGNSSLGANSLFNNSTGNENTGVGNGSLFQNNTGNFNTSVGSASTPYSSSGTGNTAIGYRTLAGNFYGNYNTAIGYEANVDHLAVGNVVHQFATAIGANSYADCDHCIVLGGYNGFFSNAAKVGINNYTPLTDLHIIQQSNANGDDTRGIELQQGRGGNQWRTFIDPANNYIFQYNNSTYSYIDPSGAMYNASDARLKKDIEPMPTMLSKLLQLKAMTYRYKQSVDGAPLAYGFIAQEVEKIFPDFVSAAGNGYKGIAYSNFGVIAIEAIQEQQKQIMAQQNDIEELKKSLKLLESELVQLKQQTTGK